MPDLIIYQSEDGKLKLDARLEKESIWLSQSQIAALLGVQVPAISKHINNIYEEGELQRESTLSKMETVQFEGKREVTREIDHYNLDMILSVGYRVNSSVATRFRQWATQTLKEYIIKGFVMDDERMENSDRIRESGYFDELLERVRKIRTSEKMFYEKVKNIFSVTSYDYDPKSTQAKEFFATVQNKFHFAVTGRTAAELVIERINSEKRNAGLTVFKGERPRIDEAIIAKNYMDEDELRQLYLISEQFLSFAELQIHKKRMMYMKDWLDNLDAMLTLNKLAVLTGKGSISHDDMEARVKTEMQRYNMMKAILGEPKPIWPEAPRYCPERPFPPYRFTPGLNPHPRQNLKGHAYGQSEEKPIYLPPEKWRENKTYLFGVDLYHQGYLWESHEAWESLWHLTDKEGVEGQFLQGLIQNAAAQLKTHLQEFNGARHLRQEAIRRFEFVMQFHPIFMGLALAPFLESLKKQTAPLLNLA